MSRHTSMSFLLLSGAALLAGCGGDDKSAVTGQPAAVQCPPGQIYDGRLCQTVGAPGATTAPTATATVPPATTGAPATGLPAGIPGVATPQTGPSATPLDPTQAQAATALITPLGQQHAPAGAKAVGSAIAGNRVNRSSRRSRSTRASATRSSALVCRRSPTSISRSRSSR